MTTARERTRALKGTNKSKAAGVLRFSIDGKTFDVDSRSLTIRENYTKKKMLAESEYPDDDTSFGAAATAWVIARRTSPDLDFEAVLDALTVGDIIDSLKDVEEDLENPEG